MTSIDSLMYSSIVLPQSEAIINLKSVHIAIGCNSFCSSDVQVVIFTVSYISVLLVLCELKYQWKAKML